MSIHECRLAAVSVCWWPLLGVMLCSPALALLIWGDPHTVSVNSNDLRLERILFYNGLYQVYLERTVQSKTNKVVNCTVFANSAIVIKKATGGSVRSVMHQEYLPMLAECENFNADSLKQRLRSTRANFHTSDNFRSLLGSYAYSSYPGTRWCGIGILALAKDNIGRLKNIDRCCRTHYYCSESIQAGEAKHGLHNRDIYPRRHCQCDKQLFRCLKNLAPDEDADLVGHMYFNVLRIECFDYSYPGKCLMYNDDGFCQAHDEAVNALEEARYQWFVNPPFKREHLKKIAAPSSQTPDQTYGATTSSKGL